MKRIIMVDDDPAIQDAYCRILEQDGYAVTVYINGQPLLTGNFDLPDLIILDKQLSGADGLDIYRYLKQQQSTKALPTNMLSASPQIQSLALQAGADDFLEKPFNYLDLLNIIKRHIP